MAKEVLHDAMGWASVRALVHDAGDWTPPGPGARRGLNRIYGRPRDLGSLAFAGSDAEDRFVAEMRLMLAACRAADPQFCAAMRLDLHDVQFQLCEFDKYSRAGDGGRSGYVMPYRPVRGSLTFAAGAPPPGMQFREPSEEWHASRGSSGGDARVSARAASPTDEGPSTGEEEEEDVLDDDLVDELDLEGGAVDDEDADAADSEDPLLGGLL